jgi:hypothetical protein
MTIVFKAQFETMKKYNLTPEALMSIFDKRAQMTWLELLNVIFLREASMFEKCALAKSLEILQTKNWIERLPGDTVQWKITETGRYQFSSFEKGNEAFNLVGQTPN